MRQAQCRNPLPRRKRTGIVRKYVECSQKTLRTRAEPQSKRIEEEKHEKAAHNTVKDSRHHKGAPHIPMPRPYQVHHAYFVPRRVDSKAYRIERYQKRADGENRRDGIADPLRGVNDAR